MQHRRLIFLTIGILLGLACFLPFLFSFSGDSASTHLPNESLEPVPNIIDRSGRVDTKALNGNEGKGSTQIGEQQQQQRPQQQEEGTEGMESIADYETGEWRPATISEAMRLIDVGLAEETRDLHLPKADLFIRTFSGHVGWLPLVLQSIEWFWPTCLIGKVIVVMDKDADEVFTDMLITESRRFPASKFNFSFSLADSDPPPRFMEGLKDEEKGKMKGRWSGRTAWWRIAIDEALKFTSSDYVILFDADAPLIWPLSPDLLYAEPTENENEKEKRKVGTRKEREKGIRERNAKWRLKLNGRRCDEPSFKCMFWPSTSAVTGLDKDSKDGVDFMRQLPFPVTRTSLERFPQWLMKQHPTAKSLDDLWQNKVFPLVQEIPTAHLDWLGNYMLLHTPEDVFVSWDMDEDSPMLARYAQHMGHMWSNIKGAKGKLQDFTYKMATEIMGIGACLSLPPELRPKSCWRIMKNKHSTLQHHVNKMFHWFDCGGVCWPTRRPEILSEGQRLQSRNWERARRGAALVQGKQAGGVA